MGEMPSERGSASKKDVGDEVLQNECATRGRHFLF
jgi:hypothetical protein